MAAFAGGVCVFSVEQKTGVELTRGVGATEPAKTRLSGAIDGKWISHLAS